MKKFKIQNQSIQKLSRKDQQNILGGRPELFFCQYGCHASFIGDGDECIVPTLDGTVCRGIIQNNLCCIS
ncbi:MAG TPA: hypothetical protein DCS93_40960 [Microscillaceae bacterium]|nr:hypothetical protein [Microscillaceae bacterium]